MASPSAPPLAIETLPPLSASSISSPTHYSPLMSSPPQYSSSTSSPTKFSSKISPSRCSLPMSSPKQRSPLISLSPLSLSAIAAVAEENSSIELDVSRSSRELPAPPKLSFYPTNKQNRSFHSIWYSTCPWLEYSIKQSLAYCYCCRHFSAGFNLLNRVSKILLRHKQLRLQMSQFSFVIYHFY